MKPEDITLDWLHARVVERDGCLIWQGGYGGAKLNHPQMFTGKTHVSARKVIWELANGRKMPKGSRAKGTCGEHGCIHPDHITKVRHGAELIGANTGMAHRISVAMTRRKCSRFTDETINGIRNGDITRRQAIDVHGMSSNYYSKVKAGVARRDYSNPMSPHWLGGRS